MIGINYEKFERFPKNFVTHNPPILVLIIRKVFMRLSQTFKVLKTLKVLNTKVSTIRS